MPVPPAQISAKQVERAIRKGAKRVVIEVGKIASTRSGNKELEHLAGRLANHSFASLTAAEAFGEELGQRLVALSQQLNRTSLDQGIIRQLMRQKQLPLPGDFPTKTADQSAEPKHTKPVAIATAELTEPVAEAIEVPVVTPPAATAAINDLEPLAEPVPEAELTTADVDIEPEATLEFEPAAIAMESEAAAISPESDGESANDVVEAEPEAEADSMAATASLALDEAIS